MSANAAQVTNKVIRQLSAIRMDELESGEFECNGDVTPTTSQAQLPNCRRNIQNFIN